ncbi:MAG: DUF1552 domain-containing protein [Myxococcota bacterium]
MGFQMKRRAFLRGAAGAAVGLPLLEAMEAGGTARADDSRPCYFALFMGGTSIPRVRDTVPDNTGRGYDLKPSIAAIGDYAGLQDKVSVVTGLTIPWQTGSEPPPAGKVRAPHDSVCSPLLSGMRSFNDRAEPNGPTADQLVVESLDPATDFRSLELRVQVEHYRSGGGRAGWLSWERRAGEMVARQPIVSPQTVYTTLFGNFAPSGAAQDERDRLLLQATRDRSVLDLVRERADALQARLGTPDRRRLERHFDEIRDLENRIAEVPEVVSTCSVPNDPGTDPGFTVMPGDDGRDIGWGREDLRARVLGDMMAMAFACDRTRVASMLITHYSSFMSAVEISGHLTDCHELGHNGSSGLDGMVSMYNWHVDTFAYVADRLNQLPDGLGGTLLDHASLVFVQEGGRGLDPSTGNENSSHSTENMVVMVAGGAGGMRTGEHHRGDGGHPGSVMLSAMRAVGYEGVFGEVTESFAPIL